VGGGARARFLPQHMACKFRLPTPVVAVLGRQIPHIWNFTPCLNWMSKISAIGEGEEGVYRAVASRIYSSFPEVSIKSLYNHILYVYVGKI
jgi:hypothetical protein